MSFIAPIILTGGAKTGLVHSSWPFARLIIEPTQLVLHAHLKEFVFSSEDELEIAVARHVLFRIPTGIQILHNNPDYPDRVVFWYLRTQKLLDYLSITEFADKLSPPSG